MSWVIGAAAVFFVFIGISVIWGRKVSHGAVMVIAVSDGDDVEAVIREAVRTARYCCLSIRVILCVMSSEADVMYICRRLSQEHGFEVVTGEQAVRMYDMIKKEHPA